MAIRNDGAEPGAGADAVLVERTDDFTTLRSVRERLLQCGISTALMSESGQKHELPRRSIGVRFALNKQTPTARVQCDAMCHFRTHAVQQTSCVGCDDLLDHLVGEREERGRDGKTERSRRSRVDDELDLGGLHHRQVAWRFSPENARRAQSDATIGIAEIGSVAHQPAGAREIAIGAHRRHCMPGGRAAERRALIGEHGVGGDHHRPDLLLLDAEEGLLELAFVARVHHHETPIEQARCVLHLPQRRRSRCPD